MTSPHQGGGARLMARASIAAPSWVVSGPRGFARLDTAALILFLILLAGIEVIVSVLNPVLVFPLHGGLVALTTLYVVVRSFGRGPRASADTSSEWLIPAAVALAAAPLIRIVSLTLPLSELGSVLDYVAAGIPLLVIGFVAHRSAGLSIADIGLAWRSSPWHWRVIVLSVLFGLGEYWILRPAALGPAPWTIDGIIPALAVGVFTGFPEELIFRGVIQTALRPLLGKTSWIYASAVFAILHIGYLSLIDLVFVFGVGLVYGWVFDRTGSILSISIGHGIANITLFFIAPYALGGRLPELSSTHEIPLAISSALGILAVLVAWHLRSAIPRAEASVPTTTEVPVTVQADHRPPVPVMMSGVTPGYVAAAPFRALGPIRTTVVARPDRVHSPTMTEVSAQRVTVHLTTHATVPVTRTGSPGSGSIIGRREYAEGIDATWVRAMAEIPSRLRSRSWAELDGKHALYESAHVRLVDVQPRPEDLIGEQVGPLDLAATFSITMTATPERSLVAAAIHALEDKVTAGYRLTQGSVRGVVVEARVHDAIVAYDIQVTGTALEEASGQATPRG